MKEESQTSQSSKARRPAGTFSSGEYNMDHPERGIALVINIMNFDGQPGMKRYGSEKDVESITDALEYLGFQVMLHQDKTALEIQSILSDVANMDHSNSDCFACVIMSHGEEAGILGRDGQIVSENDLCKSFNDTPSLNGKPKLFFIQASRGIQIDNGISKFPDEPVIESDENKVVRKPLRGADILIHFATVHSYVAYMTVRGSYFIQTLSKALKKKATKESLMEVLTFVNCEIASMDLDNDDCLQMPEISYCLRGRVILKPKKCLVKRYFTSGQLMYEGEWKVGNKHGQGKLYYENGSIKYEGEFSDDQYNGRGKYYYADGDLYKGEWMDGKKHGQGKFLSANGDRYEGEWNYGKRHGQGKIYYKDGSKYEGEFKNDEYSGQGKYYFEDGDWYEGEWKDGKRHGQGKEYNKDGSIKLEGEFSDDKFCR